ncbi:hypothetical protein LSTR_LSTR006726 [Laodelphax striatellus]|uniref:Thymus-specific serine protease n=1 Tax=Laodelphax striatellus TaxID=195883 RepID=A0A482XTI5_LAOST|nr:hypothetical protein LSTR_LSTR006726 [Laodelphax striatellus]
MSGVQSGIWGGRGLNGIGFSRRIKDPEPHPNIPQDNDSKDEWFDQKLDHTNNSDGTTWKQRYFKRETFWKRGKSQNKTNMPLFVMIGGEGEASPAWLQGGYWLQPAMKYNALLFELEHRFYGKSHPTKFTDANVKKRIDYTNSAYKGKKADPNVCYVHGSIDPWKALGIGEDQGAIIIEGTSHCADMNTPSSGDLPSLKAGREKITKFLDKKLQ